VENRRGVRRVLIRIFARREASTLPAVASEYETSNVFARDDTTRNDATRRRVRDQNTGPEHRDRDRAPARRRPTIPRLVRSSISRALVLVVFPLRRASGAPGRRLPRPVAMDASRILLRETRPVSHPRASVPVRSRTPLSHLEPARFARRRRGKPLLARTLPADHPIRPHVIARHGAVRARVTLRARVRATATRETQPTQRPSKVRATTHVRERGTLANGGTRRGYASRPRRRRRRAKPLRARRRRTAPGTVFPGAVPGTVLVPFAFPSSGASRRGCGALDDDVSRAEGERRAASRARVPRRLSPRERRSHRSRRPRARRVARPARRAHARRKHVHHVAVDAVHVREGR
jgi:hypothetical protein